MHHLYDIFARRFWMKINDSFQLPLTSLAAGYPLTFYKGKCKSHTRGSLLRSWGWWSTRSW